MNKNVKTRGSNYKRKISDIGAQVNDHIDQEKFLVLCKEVRRIVHDRFYITPRRSRMLRFLTDEINNSNKSLKRSNIGGMNVFTSTESKITELIDKAKEKELPDIIKEVKTIETDHFLTDEEIKDIISKEIIQLVQDSEFNEIMIMIDEMGEFDISDARLEILNE